MVGVNLFGAQASIRRIAELKQFDDQSRITIYRKQGLKSHSTLWTPDWTTEKSIDVGIVAVGRTDRSSKQTFMEQTRQGTLITWSNIVDERT